MIIPHLQVMSTALAAAKRTSIQPDSVLGSGVPVPPTGLVFLVFDSVCKNEYHNWIPFEMSEYQFKRGWVKFSVKK